MKETSDKSAPKLGLVCITASEQVRFKTIIRKRLLLLDRLQAYQTLKNIYQENVLRLNKAIDFCIENKIRLYRMSSGLFPFADAPIGRPILKEFEDQLKKTGQEINQNYIRLVIHPDQFVVLSSDSEQVIENSIKNLEMHASVLDLLEQPCSNWAAMNIHGGKGDRKEKLIATVKNLPENIRLRLTLENDEHAYNAEKILEVCFETDLAMVFDAHHHICAENLDSYDNLSIRQMLLLARQTWQVPEWQLVHISNGRSSFNDPSHSDLITTMPEAFCSIPWIEVEAKSKELAINKLQLEWLSGINL
jgi:UV DNA damage endonuclease